MSFTIHTSTTESIISLHLQGDITADALLKIFEEGATQLQKLDGAGCLLLDLYEVTAIQTEEFASAVYGFQQHIPDLKVNGLIFLAVVCGGDLHPILVHLFKDRHITVPVFESPKSALSYLSLKLSGAYVMQSVSGKGTADVSTMRLRVASQAVDNNPSHSGNDLFPTGGILHLENVENGREILVMPKAVLVIGRQDEQHRKPDIDLTMWGAFHRGVSRHHAEIHLEDERHLSICDTESTNGTMLNGVRLEPHRRYRLHEGDFLIVGNLMMRVAFQTVVK